MQGGDDNFSPGVELFGQIRGVFVFINLGHHPVLVLDLVNIVLKLLVEIAPVGNDDNAVENRPVIGPVQAGQLMGGPGDGVGFARSGAVLDQIVFTNAVFERGRQQLAGRFELVIARKNQRFALLFLAALVMDRLFCLQVDKAMNDVEPAVLFPNLLPQIAGFITGDVMVLGRIAPPSLAAAVKRQEKRSLPGQPGGHIRFIGVNRKMHQRPFFELDERGFLGWHPVFDVLQNGVDGRLAGEGVFELNRGDGQAVEREQHVDALFAIQVKVHLAHDGQPILPIKRFGFGIETGWRPEIGQTQKLPAIPHPVAHHVEQPPRVAFAGDALDDVDFGRGPINRGQLLPRFGLGFF